MSPNLRSSTRRTEAGRASRPPQPSVVPAPLAATPPSAPPTPPPMTASTRSSWKYPGTCAWPPAALSSGVWMPTSPAPTAPWSSWNPVLRSVVHGGVERRRPKGTESAVKTPLAWWGSLWTFRWVAGLVMACRQCLTCRLRTHPHFRGRSR